MKKFVIISGNIGSGKSSLTELLSKQLGWKAFYEVVEDNPYLEDFYYDMKKWSFHLQVFFLSKRFKHHQNIVNDPCSVVQLMEARDYHNYSELFEIMVDFLTLYEKWVKEFSLCPVLEIATDGLDFVQEPGHLKFVIEKILAKLQLIEKTFSN